jgi:hypothetical protein
MKLRAVDGTVAGVVFVELIEHHNLDTNCLPTEFQQYSGYALPWSA